MKLVKEDIEDLFRPKSEKEINQSISQLSPKEKINFGFSHMRSDIFKLGIEEGGELNDMEFTEIYDVGGEWRELADMYLEKTKEIDPNEALRLAIKTKQPGEIRQILDLNIDIYKLPTKKQGLETRADVILNMAMENQIDFDTIKYIYNHPKINKAIKANIELNKKFVEKYNIDFLDLILSDK